MAAPESGPAMPDLSALDRLLQEWRQWISRHPAIDDFSRHSGYISGLTICADQLQGTLEGMRADA